MTVKNGTGAGMEKEVGRRLVVEEESSTVGTIPTRKLKADMATMKVGRTVQSMTTKRGKQTWVGGKVVVTKVGRRTENMEKNAKTTAKVVGRSMVTGQTKTAGTTRRLGRARSDREVNKLRTR